MRITRSLFCVSKLPKNFGNFPEKYVKKHTEFIEWKPEKRPHVTPSTKRWRFRAYYDKYRPWEMPFRVHNAPGQKPPLIYVEPFEIFPVFKGDRVQILTGKDKDKIGTVCYTVPERNWVFVFGMNRSLREMRDKDDMVNMVAWEEEPLLYPRDVVLTDPSDKMPSLIKWRYDEEGRRVRVSLRTGRIIELPPEAYQTVDYKNSAEYIERPKDTRNEDVVKQTYVPVLKTFEMEIAEEMGIVEDRIPHKTFWY